MMILRKFVDLNIKYSKLISQKFPKFFIRDSFYKDLIAIISSDIDKRFIKNILEIGGADRPLLKKGLNYILDGLDIQSSDNTLDVYDNFYLQSIEEKIPENYDCIISVTLLEHVKNNNLSVSNIYNSLNFGGVTHHYIPSKYHPYSLSLQLVGPILQKKLIPILRPGYEEITGYPTYFNCCTVNSMKDLFLKSGFTNVNVKVYYRANEYFRFFILLFFLVTAFENFCKWMKLDLFASGFVISATKEEL
jgi:hypothetical protein